MTPTNPVHATFRYEEGGKTYEIECLLERVIFQEKHGDDSFGPDWVLQAPVVREVILEECKVVPRDGRYAIVREITDA